MLRADARGIVVFSVKGVDALKQPFSGLKRSDHLRAMAEKELDLLVIGGGITGAGIALDARTRGLSVGLVEMQDFAAGTSSRSTKLVHGGLRYLKQLEIGLVAEVGKERAIVYENGPHVTTPEWMLLPVIEGGTFGRTGISIGLFVYDRLAGVKKEERRRMLSPEETLQREPLLRKEGLKGAGLYVEYRTDDARLTLEVLKEAVKRGALAANYAKAENLLYRDGKVAGAEVVDTLTGESHRIYAKKVVNATGPWVDELREKDGSKTGKTIQWSKGIHIVTDQKHFPLRHAVYFDAPDGRMVFAIPRDGKTYIGTTDTEYHGDLARPRMSAEDRDYLLRAVNGMFPSVRLTADQIESGWAGIRPLIREEGKPTTEISRKDEIFLSKTGLITIAGGKLTGYRKMAQRVVDRVCAELAEEGAGPFGPCVTERIPLSGGDFGGSDRFPAFVEEKAREGTGLGLDEREAQQLVRRYGTNIDKVFGLIASRGKEAEAYGLPPSLYATLIYAVEEEMAATPADFWVRRTGDLFFDIQRVKRWKEPVLACMRDVCGWDEETCSRRRADLDRCIQEATEFV
jgi:glycerol-3-phosphate dehydrogenase